MVCVWFSYGCGCFVFGDERLVDGGDFIGRELSDGFDSVVAQESGFVDIQRLDAFLDSRCLSAGNEWVGYGFRMRCGIAVIVLLGDSADSGEAVSPQVGCRGSNALPVLFGGDAGHSARNVSSPAVSYRGGNVADSPIE